MFTLKLLLKRSCWTFIFMALALPASARVCFLPDSTDCGEGDVDVPEVQITCATYGGYETEAACLEARTNKTAQTCTLNSGCYYPKCAYDSERKCKNENPDKNCLSQDVDGVKCWYSQLKTCFDQGYKSACSSDENSTPVNIEAFDGPCYKCTEKATCKQMKPGVYYGPNDTCPKYTDRKDAGVSARDGKCSTCEPQACSAINTAYKSEAKKDTCGSNKEAKKVEGTDSAADGPCYTCEDKPVEKNCVDINKDYKNKNQVSQCENYEPVKGISAADGQCYKCVDKPLDKCVDIEATPFLDIIEPTVTTVKASGEVKEVNATLECGINPKKAYKYEINIITDYDYIKLPVKRIKSVEYRYKSGSLPGYYYKTNIDGKNVCITDSLCTQYAKEGKYISAYEIFIKDMSVKLDHKVYCCKTDDNFSGDSLSHLYSSCKEALPFSEPQHIDKYTGVYFDPVYVCDKGVKEGTKCKIGSYSCPKDYKLSGDNCVKKECPKGYVLTSDNGKDVCVNPTYTCPTDGKYKYRLSGDKCVCDKGKTCKEIGLQFGKNLVGEETGCAGSGIEGKVFTYEWAYDEAGEAIQGSDGDCIICKPTSEVNIYTSNSKCYKITSITGDNVVKIAEHHYSVPLESNFTINAEKDLTSSKWNTGYCKSIYPYIEIDNMSSAYENTKQYSYKESKTFTLNDDFLEEYKIVENEMSVSPVEEPVTYTAELYLENDDCPYVEGICPSAGIVVSDASDDEYMKDVSVDVVMSINCCGYKDGCGSPYPNIVFDGKSWWNYHYTTSEQCYYTFGTSEFRIYKRSEGKYIATIKGFGCAKINDGAIEICIQEY